MNEAAIVWFQSSNANHTMEDTMADDFRMALDDLVKSLGMTGISKSQVSRLC